VVSLNLKSPSREHFTLEKALTDIGSGFFSFEITAIESELFIDDTYSYWLTQGENLLKHGFVNLEY